MLPTHVMAIPSTPTCILNFNHNQQKCVALEKLWMQRESGRFCDIVLHVQGQKFQAHKNVLAACSPYFDSLLRSQSGNEELLILCQSLEAFKFLLKFLYTGNVSVNENNVSELLVLASHFLMDNLKNYCAEFLNQFLDLPNCLTVLEMSNEYDLRELHKNAIEFVLNHVNEVFELSEILEIDFDKIKSLLEEISNFIPQYLLLDFICKWVNHNISERTNHFKVLLMTVNWQCVESKFLENHLKTCSLLQNNIKCSQTLSTCLKKNRVKLAQSQNSYDLFIISPLKTGESNNSGKSNKTPSLYESSVQMDFKTTNSNTIDSSDIRSKKIVENSDTVENGGIDSQGPVKNLSEVLGIFETISVPDREDSNCGSAVSSATVKGIDIVPDHEVDSFQSDTEIVLTLTSTVSAEEPSSLDADLCVTKSEKSISDCINYNNHKSPSVSRCTLPGHLNVLAEVTELFSNCSPSNIKESDASIDSTCNTDKIKLSSEFCNNVKADLIIDSNVCATPSKNLVHRPAIHYLSKTNPKDAIQEICSDKKSSNDYDTKCNNKPNRSNISISSVYSLESNAEYTDDCNLSLNDSNSNCDFLYSNTQVSPTADLPESNSFLDVPKSKSQIALSQINKEFPKENSNRDNAHPLNYSRSTAQNLIASQEFIVYSKNVESSEDCKRPNKSTVEKVSAFDSCVQYPFVTNPGDTLDATVGVTDKKIAEPIYKRQAWKESIKCNSCSYVARTSHRLQKHMNTIHAKDITYKCKVCNFTCKWQREYSAHLKTHFKGPPFSCDICNYTNNRLPSLLAHRLTHTLERPFKCELCERQTRTKAELDYHMRRHTGEKPFQCETCHRAFALKSCLDQHVLSHGTERTYLCDKCGFSAKYKSHLLNHKRVHRGNVFRCKFEGCSYFTPVRNSFFAHQRIHTNDRPFLCRTCGKSFIENSQMKRHERTHMDVRLFFNCDHCEYATTRRDRLKDHRIKYHSEGAKTTYKPRKLGNSRTKNSHLSVKKHFVPCNAVKTVSPSEPDVPAPPIVIAHGNELPGQELVVVTSTLSKEHGPVTFLQVLPSNANASETKT